MCVALAISACSGTPEYQQTSDPNGAPQTTVQPLASTTPNAPAQISAPAARTSALTASPPRPGSTPRPAGPSENEIRAKAASWKNVPYRDDGTTRKGISNAALVAAIVKDAFAIQLPARVDDQMKTGKLVERKDLQAGDLVFFEGKGVGPFRSRSVGLFLGRGDVALAKKDLGVATVRLSDDPWASSFKTARRVSTPASADAPEFDVAAYGGNRDALLRDVAKAWVGTLYKQGGTTFEGIGNDEFVRSIYEAFNDDDLDGRPQQWAVDGPWGEKGRPEAGRHHPL